MGDPTGGLFGLASSAADAGGGGGGAADPNAPDTGGGGSFDPSAGMGGTDPGMGSAMGAADVAAPGVDPGIASLFGQAGGGGGYDPTGTTTAQQQIAGGGNLGPPGQPPTDQPSPQRYASAGGRPDVTPQETGYRGLDPRTYTQTANLTATPGQPPTPAPDIAHAFAGSGPDAPGIHWDPIEGDPQYIRQGPSVTVSPEESQTGQHGVDAAPPKPPTYAPPATQEGTRAGDLTTDTKGNKIPGGIPSAPTTAGAAPPATPPATAAGGGGTTAAGGAAPDASGAAGPATDAAGQQGQQAGMGRMPQSPLEQLIGQLLHPLEQMIMRALGINPNALFHAFQGGNPFNRQAGPGYYPPGTRGGRTVQSAGPPSLTPAPAQRGGQPQTPPRTPGPPGTPGNQPSATPPGRREAGGFDPTLPGYPYTGETRDQPPPWYRGGTGAPPSPREAGAPTQQDISATRIAGSDTRPTPGFSNYLRNQRAPFMREMEANPRLKLQVAAIASFEHPQDPRAPVEALMNRAALTKTSLQNRIFFKDKAGNTFYGPINKGLLNQRMIQLQNNPQELNRYYQAIDSVGHGTNLIAGATDQGSGNDPNVHNPSGRVIRFGETYNDWRFPQAAAWRRAQQAAVRRELQAGY